MGSSLAVPRGKISLFKKKQKPFTGEKLKVGIIGCGWIATSHIDCYLKMNDVEVVAVADLIDGKAQQFADRYHLNCRVYKSHTEMLANEKLDVVSVCTYNRTHAVCSIDAMKAGANVICEKPMCVTLEEGIEMVRTAKETGKKLSIGFQPRMSDNFKKIKQIVQSGELGKVYYVQTGGGRPFGIPTPYGTSFIEEDTAGIGAVGDIGCYSLDLVLFALGYPKPLTVSGYMSDYFGKNPDTYPKHPEYAEKFGVDDFAAGFIRLEGGICLDFRIAWAMNLPTSGDTIFMGTEKSLRVPSTECWNGSLPKPLKEHKVTHSGLVVTKRLGHASGSGDVFFAKIRSFVDAVRNDTPVCASGEQILYNQAIIDGIVRSAKLGKEVAVEIPEI